MIPLTIEGYSSMLDQYFSDGKTYLYGAGETGKRYFHILCKLGFRIDGFIDDDISKQGGLEQGKYIYSYEYLVQQASATCVNIIISSIYGNVLLPKLEKLPIKIFDAFALYEKYYKITLENNLRLGMSDKAWLKKLEVTKSFYADDISLDVLSLYENYVKYKKTSYEWIAQIASPESHYFISEVREMMRQPINIIDFGAYTGDMLWQILKLNLKVNKVYAIEVNEKLFKKLEETITRLSMNDSVVPICVALWDKKTKLRFVVPEDHDTAGHISSSGSIIVQAKSLDDIIEDSIGFIKMDIEGAELPALRGGQRILKKCRPILAISIYHSLDDIVEIPLYLHDLLPNYNFLIRHHSLIYSETVLYGIPNEYGLK